MMAQIPVVAVQAILPPEKSPVGVSTVNLLSVRWQCHFCDHCPNRIANILIEKLTVNVDGADLQSLLLSGSGAIRALVLLEDLPTVLGAFNQALISTFYMPVVESAAAFVISLGVPWVNVKGMNLIIETDS
jgi:hypothetical protein